MKSLTLMLLVAFAMLTIWGSAVSAGELSPAQKSEAVQKSAIQKDAAQKDATQKDATQSDAVQKSESAEPVGWRARRRDYREARIDARLDRWTVSASCRSGSCR